MKKNVKKIAEQLADRTKEPALVSRDMLSSGSTMLNLACTGRTLGAFPKGCYVFFVGDSESGKTFFTLTCMAEAAANPKFDEHRFIYDATEDGALMDLEYFYGTKMASRLEPPAKDKFGESMYSDTLDDFYFNLDDACQAGKPFIYILDSMDGVTSEEEEKKFQERKVSSRKRRDGGKEEKLAGSYGDGKAKKNSAMLRRFLRRLKSTGSILIIISQSRDNVGAFTFEKKTRSGGRALKFYAHLEIWTSVVGSIKKTVNGKPRAVGQMIKVQLKKNRLNGQKFSVEVPIYPTYGFDDLGSCVNYLLEEKHWKKGKGGLHAPEFDFTGSEDKLIKHIEEEGLQKKLRSIVRGVWKDIQSKCKLERKPRYE